MDDPAAAMTGLPPSPLERRWHALAPPACLDSARALYDLLPALASVAVPGVSAPLTYDPRTEWHWNRAARVADFAARAPEGARVVLDIGPGDGWPSLPLAAARPDLCVVGVEPSPQRARTFAANAAARQRPNVRTLLAEAGALPLADASIDYAIASYSLEEAAEPLRAFAEVARVLRPGGVLRATCQDWRLPAAEVETVSLLEGRGCLLYQYARRVQRPAVERRYVLALLPEGEAAALVADALAQAAEAPRAYGETLLASPDAPLGVPLLERLAPHARRSMRVDLVRWTAEWLADALREAGFREVRITVHPGDLARAFARSLRERGALDAVAPQFDALTRALGEAGGEQPGRAMVMAVR